ncbi:P-loop containing nucleoside triphosphate hydrolase protein [Lasiosphaeris hirsuta]|uniref:P-loop containing nucleoside triphosphate hydrolase protein n=1 Tax=Lasiosphaeris hirsuta TaxID=260670 RepID=A0AA40DRG9_9PEZI|nr:P-loop containing nucleoside triphosphate hydrolase protein [Lasiosphaeris hirsuta]
MESFDSFPLADMAVVVVMGATGSGKSSFISLLADEPVEVSHNLHSHTIRIRPYRLRDQVNGKRVFLVDTPGFDDTSRSDAEILKDISFFLTTLNVRLAGLIYLHRISDPRMSGSAAKNFRLFKSLCGEQNFRNVALATTMWSDDEEERATQRQRLGELRATFWADMVLGGCSVKKHRGDEESALNIVRDLTESGTAAGPITLTIQRELGVERRTLDATAVGKLLLEEINIDRDRAARELAELQLGLEEAERDNDDSAAASMREEQSAAEARFSQRSRDQESLSIGIDQLTGEQRPRYHQTIDHLLREQEPGHEERRASPASPRTPKHPRKNTMDAAARSGGRSRRSKRRKETPKSDSELSERGDPWQMDNKTSPPQRNGRSKSNAQQGQATIKLMTWIATT